ncbi:MAG: glycosyltransferase [Mesonia sp.]|uniref:glycosyltransferase n=1 Tax=Mesonia sp. TaxID=1960830 RepID=UPI0032422315
MIETSKKKILFLSLSLRKGGAENQLMKLAIFLSRRNFEIFIIYFVEGNDFKDRLKNENIRIEEINIISIKGLKRYNSELKKIKPDIIISFMFGANMIGRFSKIMHKVPLITSVRNNQISLKYKFLYRYSYKIDTITTFNSQYALNKFIELKLTDPKKSILIKNAIEIAKNYKSSIVNDDFVLISLAHFRPQKDYYTLFYSIEILIKRGFKVKLIVLGHLYNQKWPEELISKLNLEKHIELVGFTNNTFEYLKKSDALILSSMWEGTPNALLEGMAAKLPVIATNISGNRELIVNSKSGYLFEVGKPLELAERIKKLIVMPSNERENIGLKGYDFVLNNYHSDKVHNEWLELINNNIK